MPPPWMVVISQYHCYCTPIINTVTISGPKGRVYHGDNIPMTCVLRSPPETFVQYIKAPPGSNDTYTLFTHVNPSPEGNVRRPLLGGVMIIMVPTLEPLYIYTCIYIHMYICIGPPGGEVCIKVSPGNPHTPINCTPPHGGKMKSTTCILPWREMWAPSTGSVIHI